MRAADRTIVGAWATAAILACAAVSIHGRELSADQHSRGLQQQGFRGFRLLPGEALSLPPVAEPENLQPCFLDNELDECNTPEVCVPFINQSNGVCADVPVGGVVIPSETSSFPSPIGYFPLTGGSLASWPQSRYVGASTNLEWRKDVKFGSVLHCNQEVLPVLALPNVPFGSDGSFAINMWIKKHSDTSLAGNAFQYIFSITSLANAKLRLGRWDLANQVHVFIPESFHAAAGLVRVLIQDSDDGGSTYYMDSDGRVNRDSERSNKTKHADLNDEEWHMLTVTTLHGKSKKGFRIFVDGKLVAETPAKSKPHGGHPIFADGNIFLCGRVDNHHKRHFDGSLAHLSIFDVSLSQSQVRNLYNAMNSGGSTSQDDLEFFRLDPAVERTFEMELDPDELEDFRAARGNLNTFIVQDFVDRAQFCRDGDDCGEGNTCAALHFDMIISLARSNTDVKNGMCAATPVGDIQVGPEAGTPIPFAYFPFTGGDTRSWPIPQYSGLPIRVGLEEDDVFGSVFTCSQKNLSVVVLDDLDYGMSGEFAVSLWFRASNLEGPFFQYLFSQVSVFPQRSIWGEQLSIYLAESQHASFGLLRVIYKDSDDILDEVYLDSDGLVGVTELMKREPKINITDGNWHMVSVTTNPLGEKGFKVYLDAVLVGSVDKESIRESDESFQLPGGAPFQPNSPILICGRQDGHPERHFEGKIAQISVFNEALSEDDVQALYDSVPASKLDRSREANVPPMYQPSPLLEILKATPFNLTESTTPPEPDNNSTSGNAEPIPVGLSPIEEEPDIGVILPSLPLVSTPTPVRLVMEEPDDETDTNTTAIPVVPVSSSGDGEEAILAEPGSVDIRPPRVTTPVVREPEDDETVQEPPRVTLPPGFGAENKEPVVESVEVPRATAVPLSPQTSAPPLPLPPPPTPPPALQPIRPLPPAPPPVPVVVVPPSLKPVQAPSAPEPTPAGTGKELVTDLD